MKQRQQVGPSRSLLFKSSNKKYDELIIFVHHYGGHRTSLHNYQKFVAALGYDSVSFDLKYMNWNRSKKDLDALKAMTEGFRHTWERQIADVYDFFDGPKILYSFSMPSGPAAIALAKRNLKDFKGWICEGGPFFHLNECYFNYTQRFFPNFPLPLKVATVLYSSLSIGVRNYRNDLGGALKLFPSDFPILSIRAWKDQLVPPHAINSVFSPHVHLNLEVLNLMEADHLEGLKTFPEQYQSRVSEFLGRLN